MRFYNWDVLVFHQDTGIPQEEFRTESFVDYTELGDVAPTMTSYVPSLPRGAPYQISVHSWNPPCHSDAAAPYGERAAWAIRVLVDGVTVVCSTFRDDTIWPQVIGRSRDENPDSNRPLLSFPPFHKDILAEISLRLQDTQGRIKLIIYEGYFAENTAEPQFVPFRTVLTFNYIHAPIELLKQAGIAWLNPHMFNDVSPAQRNMLIDLNLIPRQYAIVLEQQQRARLAYQQRRQAMVQQPPAQPMNQQPPAQPMNQQNFDRSMNYRINDHALGQQGYFHPQRYGYPRVQQNFGQPMQQNFGQHVQQNFDQPIQQTYAQPIQQTYAQPIQQVYAQPIQQNLGQPIQQNFGKQVQQAYAQPPMHHAPMQMHPRLKTNPTVAPVAVQQQRRLSDDSGMMSAASTATVPETAPGSFFGSNVLDAQGLGISSTPTMHASGLHGETPNPLHDATAVDAKPRLEVRLPSDQIRQIVDAISPRQATQGASETDSTTNSRKASDISMHASCNEFPDCTTDGPDGGVMHTPTRRPGNLPRDPALLARKRSRNSFSDKDKTNGNVRKVSKSSKKKTFSSLGNHIDELVNDGNMTKNAHTNDHVDESVEGEIS